MKRNSIRPFETVLKTGKLLLFASALAWTLPAPVQAQPAKVNIITEPSSDIPDVPQAQVLSVHGNCEYSADGATFTPLKAGHVFKQQGAVVRTGEGARTDLFFRRIGTTVRLQPGTDVMIEKMTRSRKDGMPVMETLLDLRKGRIFTVVRSLVPGSTFEIRNAAGRSVVEGGGGKGRYIITADGTHVTDKNSAVPLKVIGETGVTVITPGQKFNAKEGKVFPLDTPEAVQLLIDFDELDSLVEESAPPENTPKQEIQPPLKPF